MNNLNKIVGAAVFGMACTSVFGRPAASDPTQRESFEAMIRDYLLRNPKVVREALRRLDAAEAERSRRIIQTRHEEDAAWLPATVNAAPQPVEFYD